MRRRVRARFVGALGISLMCATFVAVLEYGGYGAGFRNSGVAHEFPLQAVLVRFPFVALFIFLWMLLWPFREGPYDDI